MMGTTRRLLAMMVAALLVLAACGASEDQTESDAFDTDDADFSEAEESAEAPADDARAEGDVATGGDGAAPATTISPSGAGGAKVEDDQAADGEAAADEGESPLGSGGATVTPTAADIGRQLIFTAEVHVGVDDVAAASAEATKIIEDRGGFLFGQNTSGGVEPSSQLVFKILPNDFNAALEALGNVGELRNQVVTTDDVTERIVDLESRIQVSELGVDRLRAALEGSTTLEDYAELERLLLDRESDLEVMRGQLRTLQDRVDLATITLLLTQDRVENAIEVEVSTYEELDGGDSCPGDDFRSVEEGTSVTVCFDIINVGDQTLTDLALTDTSLGIDADTELTVVFGDLEALAPGQSVLLAHEVEVERDLRLRTRVTAVPTDGVSSEPSGPSVSRQVEFELRTFPSEDDPGFGDGFSVAVDVLKAMWIALTVVLGFLVPLLVLAPFVWLAWTGWRRYRAARPPRAPQGPGPMPGGYTPPPPGSNPPPPGTNPPPPATATAATPSTPADGGDAAPPD